MDWNYEIRSFSVAVRRFWRHTATNHKMLALMLLAVTSLLCVVIYYHSDKRLSNGPWSTYEDGMFSVNEPRNEDFEKFNIPRDFRARLENRSGGRLLCAYQKSHTTPIGDVAEIIHINVFELSPKYRGIYQHEPTLLKKLTTQLPYFKDLDTKPLDKTFGHEAVAFKEHTRDAGGYYSCGVMACAHKRIYYYEYYSHYSPFHDWENDSLTYFYHTDSNYPLNFTVDNMNGIENRFLLWSVFLFALFIGTLYVLYRLSTSGLHHDPTEKKRPIVYPPSRQRFTIVVAITVLMLITMLITLIALWQFKVDSAVPSVTYVFIGTLLLAVNLPALVHLYKKARGLLPQQIFHHKP